jgi:hypothetical protein
MMMHEDRSEIRELDDLTLEQVAGGCSKMKGAAEEEEETCCAPAC